MRTALRPAAAAVLGLALFAAGPVAAQGSKAAPASVALKVLRSVGTPDEAPQLQAITARFRASVAADPTLGQRVIDATVQRRFAAAKRLVAAAAGVPASKVWFPDGDKLASAPAATPFRFASTAPSRPPLREGFNPFYMVFAFQTTALCIGDYSSCYTALKSLGYTPRS